MESLTGDGHLHPGHPYNGHRRSPSLRYGNWIFVEFFFVVQITIFRCSYPGVYRRAGSPLVRTPSPRRRGGQPQHDIGFSDTVSNVVEIVKEERGIRSHRQYPHARFPRGKYIFNINIDFVFFFFF